VGGGAKRQVIPLKRSPQPHVSKYFPNRLQIELQEEKVIDSIHIHYRDYRLAMNISTFREFVKGMQASLIELDKFLEGQEYMQEEHPFRRVVQTDEWANQKIGWLQKMKYRLKRMLGKTETNK
jgi:hypothetical protein